VWLENSAEHSALTVADSGPGIPPEDRARVTDRFVRLESSRNSPGTGLGLSLVAAVAGLHEAELVLGDNDPGLRATLVFKRSGDGLRAPLAIASRAEPRTETVP
jgi:signal transduction histidine kinase